MQFWHFHLFYCLNNLCELLLRTLIFVTRKVPIFNRRLRSKRRLLYRLLFFFLFFKTVANDEIEESTRPLLTCIHSHFASISETSFSTLGQWDIHLWVDYYFDSNVTVSYLIFGTVRLIFFINFFKNFFFIKFRSFFPRANTNV